MILIFSTSKVQAVDLNSDDVGFFQMVEGFFDRAAGIMEDQLVSEVSCARLFFNSITKFNWADDASSFSFVCSKCYVFHAIFPFSIIFVLEA